jgi:uncharacterized membrane protein
MEMEGGATMNHNQIAYLLIGVMVGASITAFICVCQIRELQRQAVDHGAARWIYDAHGNGQFEWKEVSYE